MKTISYILFISYYSLCSFINFLVLNIIKNNFRWSKTEIGKRYMPWDDLSPVFLIPFVLLLIYMIVHFIRLNYPVNGSKRQIVRPIVQLKIF